MLIKRTDRQARRGTLADAFAGQTHRHLDRRTFLRRSGLTVGGLAAIGALPLATVRKADAAGSMATTTLISGGAARTRNPSNMPRFHKAPGTSSRSSASSSWRPRRVP